MKKFMLVIVFGCLVSIHHGYPSTSPDLEIFEVDLKTYVERSLETESDVIFEDRVGRDPNEFFCGDEIRCIEKEEATSYFSRLRPDAVKPLVDLNYQRNITCKICFNTSLNKYVQADNLVKEKILLIRKGYNLYEKGPVVKLYQGCALCRDECRRKIN